MRAMGWSADLNTAPAPDAAFEFPQVASSLNKMGNNRDASSILPFFRTLCFILSVLVTGPTIAETVETYDSPGNYTFTVPANVTEITVEAWGGGGRGGDTSGNNEQAGGGGAGSYASSVLAVQPADSFNIVVGAGSNSESPGGQSSFDGGTVSAPGGESVAENEPAGAAGGAQGTGQTTEVGGDGSGAVDSGGSKNGGAGGDAPNGGNGGAGATGDGDGISGESPGGGGGGSAISPGNSGGGGGPPGGGGGGPPGGGNEQQTGGAGAPGQVRITYEIQEDTVAISGQVRGINGGLSGVDITAETSSGGIAATATTDGSGDYSLSVAEDNSYTLQVAADGSVFCPSQRQIEVDDFNRPGIGFQGFPDSAGPDGAGAGGDSIFTASGDVVHVFCNDGEFTPPTGVDAVDVLVIGGGGGGGAPLHFSSAGGGGGGAGGVVQRDAYAIDGAVDVGVGEGGGAGSTPGTASPGGNGTDSEFDDLVALGGGGGSGDNESGSDGGSGGGSRGEPGSEGLQPDSASGGFGNRGGEHTGTGRDPQIDRAAGGGGGADEPGEDLAGIPGEDGGAGGDGLPFAITGTSLTYAGGGGGGAADNQGDPPGDPGAGGEGGGGRGGRTGVPAIPGFPATGGGGGGGNNSVPGAAGGSGIVVVRYERLPELVLDLRMEEASWGDGATASDSSGRGNDGTVEGDSATSIDSPAIPGSPGTCRYGSFNGVDQYITVDHDDSLEASNNDAVTVTAWVRQTSDQSDAEWIALVQKSDTAYNLQLQGGTAPTFTIHDGGFNILASGVDLEQDQWYHIAGTYDGDEARIYVDGSLEGSLEVSGEMTDASSFDVGIGENLDASGRHFAGFMDEVRIYSGALTAEQVDVVRQETRPCDFAVVDYEVDTVATGLTCEPVGVEITAVDSAGNPIDPPDDTEVALTTDTDRGTWSRVRSGSGILSDAASGDGEGSYTFPGGESSVVLSFNYTDIETDPESVTITADDGNASDTSDPITISLAGFRFLDDDSDTAADTISGQIAAKPSDTGFGASNIGIQAVRASDDDPTTCEGVFDDGETVSVDVGAECRDPDNCAGNTVSVNGSSIATSDDNGTADEPAGYSAVDLEFGANSTAPLDLAYADAGALRLYARHEIVFDDPNATPSSEYLRGTSNEFVVRPFGFRVTATGNSGATSAAGDVYRTAGTGFDVEIAAVGWASGDDTDNDGVPDGYDNGDPTDNANLANNVVLPNFGPESTDESATLTSGLWQPSGGSDPGLAGTPTIDEAAFEDAGDVAAGSAGTTVQYPEVGIIELRAALDDGDYLGTGFDVPGRSVAVGRFIPADFDQTASDGMFRNTCAATFTYLGETFGYESGALPELTITARNDGGQTTRNYTGNFAKLVAADVQRTGPTDDGTTDGSDGTRLAVAPDLQQGTLTDNGDGTLTYTFDTDDGYRYERNIDRDGDGTNDARVAPFDTDLTVTIDAIEDSDGVNAPSGNRDDVTPDAARIRFGRLVIENAAGAEIAPIEQVIRAEYFAGDVSGDQWDVNVDDDGCTAFTLASPNQEIELANDEDGDSPVAGDDTIDIAGGSTGIQEAGPVALDSGTAVLTFGPPGADNTGWLDTILLLGADHPYLAIDDDGDGVWDANPSARVTFGIYTGPSGRILLREVPAN